MLNWIMKHYPQVFLVMLFFSFLASFAWVAAANSGLIMSTFTAGHFLFFLSIGFVVGAIVEFISPYRTDNQ